MIQARHFGSEPDQGSERIPDRANDRKDSSAPSAKPRLLLVSNRLPTTVKKRKGGYRFVQSVGGLATGLASFHESFDSAWVGWPGLPSETLGDQGREEVEERLWKEYSSYPVSLSRTELEKYYEGFCNRIIWPLFHYFTGFTEYEETLWKSYRSVNQRFCDAVLKVATPEDVIWVHDYQLMLLPKLLRDHLPKARIGFFLHIPFPSYEIFRLLPWRKEVLEGLLGANLVGFHTYSYARHFLNSVRSILGCEHTLGEIAAGQRLVKADAFPMGIDYERFSTAGDVPEVQKEMRRIDKKVGERQIVLSVDRLDYTKGILERIEAFQAFLDRHPQQREKVTLIVVAVPSRSRVGTYKELKRQLDEAVGRVNGKHGTLGWTPVWYLYRSLPWYALAALYRTASVALVTPLRDGMNLIAKEYIATQPPGQGVLILSEMAGAAEELGEALIVNPNNQEEVVQALAQALIRPAEDQAARTTAMQERLRSYTVGQWAKDFLGSLTKIVEQQRALRERMLTAPLRERLVEQYRHSAKRLLLLDYDGTLVPFAKTPEEAQPDSALLARLADLAGDPRNVVVIVSGRDRNTVHHWFGHLPLELCAEHGVWLKRQGEPWHTIHEMSHAWKEEIRGVVRQFVKRTPGSRLEEKDYSLVWHYRNTHPELGAARLSELKDTLLSLTENLDLGVMDGNKALEIKGYGINKGTAVLQWATQASWDFVLAMGDDVTDEDMFAALPPSAYSLKIGLGASQARYNLGSVDEARSLLEALGKA